MATWQDTFSTALDVREHRETQLGEIYRAFHSAASRAVQAEQTRGETSTDDSNSSERLNNLMQMNVAHRTNAERFEKQNLILEQALAQKTEEQKEQNKALHILQDEVLASQIQLNLLEQRADNLQLENDTLVQRLVDKAAADADKMNDANAFLESLNVSRE